jgi:thiamine-monophosphate kinase
MNEFDFISRIRKLAHERGASPGLVRGIGDDAAVLKSFTGTDIVVSTDLLVEDVDFRRDTTQPDLLGYKALAVSLSDIAAMGARPRWALLSLGVPQDIWDSGFVDNFYSGFFELAAGYDVHLVGGDISRTAEKIVIDSIAIGECLMDREVFRAGAKAGDRIFVTGFLGDAAAGLRLLERGARFHGPKMTGNFSAASEAASEFHPIDHLLLRQLRPEPRVGWGVLLGEQQLATAMIDISDGLSSDLNHLCDESKVGALIDASSIPIDPLVPEICGRRALDPLLLALHGGEDFELLFTVRPQNVARLPKKVDGVSICRIGEITSEPGKVRIAEQDRVWDLKPGGFDHFKSKT